MRINLPLKRNRVKRHKWIFVVFLTVSVLQLSAQDDPYLEGRASILKGDYHAAVVHLNRALTVQPGKTEILYQLGVTHFNLDNYPEALEALYEANKRRNGLSTLYLAKTEVRLNHPELALKYLKEHLSSRYKVPESEILLDRELSSLEEHPGWQALWNEKEWYSEEEMQFQEARFLMENGDALEAINLLNGLEKTGYNRSRVLETKANVYTDLGNRKAAVSSLKAAVKSDVRNMDALYALSAIQLEDGDAEDALAGLNRLIRQEPERFGAYLLRATARSAQGDLNGALEDLELHLSLFPGNDETLCRIGQINYAHGKYLDAIQSFNRALEINPGNARYYFARGRTYAATGTIRYAHKDMSMSLDLDPLSGEVWFEKGKLDQQLGNMQSACHCFRKAYQYGIFEAGEKVDKLCN